MIIFLHGQDSFRSRQKLNALTDQFKKQRDPDGNNIIKLEGAKLTINKLNEKTAANSLLAEKRLIIIENLFEHKEENIFKTLLEYLQQLKGDTVLIFYESRGFDSKKFGEKRLTVARKKLFDFLTKQKFSEQFNALNNAQVVGWIQKQIKHNGLNIDNYVANTLVNTLGNDLWIINNELNKLINYCQAQKQNTITIEFVRQLTHGQVDENIFALTDAIGNKNKMLFFELLEQQIESGVAETHILSMIVRQFKQILQIKELLIKGLYEQKIIDQLKLHPYVIKKTIPQTRNFSIEYCKNILFQLAQIDYKTKTGQTYCLTELNMLFS